MRRTLCLCLGILVLAGCASSGFGGGGSGPRCNRSGDPIERAACNP